MKRKKGGIINSGNIPIKKYISTITPPLKNIATILENRTTDQIKIRKSR